MIQFSQQNCKRTNLAKIKMCCALFVKAIQNTWWSKMAMWKFIPDLLKSECQVKISIKLAIACKVKGSITKVQEIDRTWREGRSMKSFLCPWNHKHDGHYVKIHEDEIICAHCHGFKFQNPWYQATNLSVGNW